MGEARFGRQDADCREPDFGTRTALHRSRNRDYRIHRCVERRKFDPTLGYWRDMPTMFTHCIVRGAQAEHAAVTLHRGHRVVVLGQLRTHSPNERGSRKGTTVGFDVHGFALSLRYTAANLAAF